MLLSLCAAEKLWPLKPWCVRLVTLGWKEGTHMTVWSEWELQRKAAKSIMFWISWVTANSNNNFFIAMDVMVSISDSSLVENSRVHGRPLAADQRRLHKQQLLSLFVKLLRLVIYPWKCPNARHICPQILFFWGRGRSQEWGDFCFFVWHLKLCTMRLVLGLAAVIIWLSDGGGRDQWRGCTAVEVFHKPNLSGCSCSAVLRNHRHTHTHTR